MKLATLRDGSRDGRLLIASRDGSRYLMPERLARTLQEAVDRWGEVAERLRAASLPMDTAPGPGTFAVDSSRLHAPLPRVFDHLDASPWVSHIVLARRARGAEPPPETWIEPLLWQGGGGILASQDSLAVFDPADGVDFEAGLAVVLDDVPQGTPAAEAAASIRLVMLASRLVLRNRLAAEVSRGYGAFAARPATAFAPLAVVPESLGAAWAEGRAHLALRVTWNGTLFADLDTGAEMHFGFPDLVEAAARSRRLPAGAVLVAAPVSSADPGRGNACIAERRMRERIETGALVTPWLHPGDTVEIEAVDERGRSVFGRIVHQFGSL